MSDFEFFRLTDRPEWKERAALWFHDRWGVPLNAYLESMNACIAGDPIQQWYLCVDQDQIVSGLGEIENDFYNRKDLTPNICAVYTNKEYRCQGLAGKLLQYAVEDNRQRGISPLYLITDHIGFYEKYGWEFLCMVQEDGESEMTRMYIHR
ncbi:MAG: GNAT family N-acetyltransferase [Erysipelotrichia bacterium]|nr:GNAT family N-acetyltransferase [Erysipelotrichia bacterium]